MGRIGGMGRRGGDETPLAVLPFLPLLPFLPAPLWHSPLDSASR
jgi:hypothetical protein